MYYSLATSNYGDSKHDYRATHYSRSKPMQNITYIYRRIWFLIFVYVHSYLQNFSFKRNHFYAVSWRFFIINMCVYLYSLLFTLLLFKWTQSEHMSSRLLYLTKWVNAFKAIIVIVVCDMYNISIYNNYTHIICNTRVACGLCYAYLMYELPISCSVWCNGELPINILSLVCHPRDR